MPNHMGTWKNKFLIEWYSGTPGKRSGIFTRKPIIQVYNNSTNDKIFHQGFLSIVNYQLLGQK